MTRWMLAHFRRAVKDEADTQDRGDRYVTTDPAVISSPDRHVGLDA